MIRENSADIKGKKGHLSLNPAGLRVGRLRHILAFLLMLVLSACGIEQPYDDEIGLPGQKGGDSDVAPVAYGFASEDLLEENQLIINLTYTDLNDDKAVSCRLAELQHVSITRTCECVDGLCSVGVTGHHDYFGDAGFSYSVIANGKSSNLARVNLTIENVDDPPKPSGVSSLTLAEESEGIITLSYSDADGDLATSCSVSHLNQIIETTSCSCVLGVCTVGVTGTLNYSGAASFSYTVTANGQVALSPAVANVTIGQVDDPPLATAFNAPPFAEDTQGLILLSYTEPDADLANSCAVSNLANVVVTQACACVAGVCRVGVTGLANYSGAASFDFTVTANGQTSQSARATLAIEPTDDAPVASNLVGMTIPEEAPTFVDLVYSDIEGDPATSCAVASLVGLTESTPCTCANGICQVGLTGVDDYAGEASFVYTVSSTSQTSNPASGSLTIDSCAAPADPNAAPFQRVQNIGGVSYKLICTAAQLSRAGDGAGQTYRAEKFFVKRDIDLAAYYSGGGAKFWLGGDAVGKEFVGVFDGGGHSIQNYSYVEPSLGWVGFFRSLGGGGVVRNVTFAGATLQGLSRVGLIGHLGGSNSIVQNVSVISSSLTVGTNGRVGGLVGNLEPASTSIENIKVADSTITSSGLHTGGVFGYAALSAEGVQKVRSLNNVVSGTTFVGGVYGLSLKGVIGNRLINSSSVYGSGTDVGGIIGRLNLALETSVQALHLVNYGSVTGGYRVGGIVGAINATSVGLITPTPTLRFGLNTGTVTAGTDVYKRAYAGGIFGDYGLSNVGASNIAVEHMINVGDVVSTVADARRRGPIAGSVGGYDANSCTMTHLYFSSDVVSALASSTNLSSCTFTQTDVLDHTFLYSSTSAPFDTFDMVSIWRTVPNSYPELIPWW